MSATRVSPRPQLERNAASSEAINERSHVAHNIFFVRRKDVVRSVHSDDVCERRPILNRPSLSFGQGIYGGEICCRPGPNA